MTKPKTKKPVPRASRTREDIADAFEDLDEEEAPPDPKTQELARARAKKVKETAATLSPDSIVGEIQNLGLKLSTDLAALQAACLAKYETLNTLIDAVALEKDELERLHKVDIALAAHDVLIREYEEKAAELETTYAERQAELEKAYQVKARELTEEQAQAQKEFERGKADWEYQEQLRRTKETDAFAQKQKEVERAMTEKLAELAKSWKEREGVLAAAEGELKELRELKAGLDERIRKERSQAEAIKENAVRRELTHEHALASKEAAQDLALAKQLADTQAKTIEQLTAQLRQAEAQRDAARAEVKEMAIASFNAAGDAKALTAVQSFNRDSQNSSAKRS